MSDENTATVADDIKKAMEEVSDSNETAPEEAEETPEVVEPQEEDEGGEEAESAPEEDLDLSDQVGEDDSELMDEFPPLEYPSSWSSEISEKVDKLPRDLQEWMSDHERKRQADYTQKSQELARANQYYTQLEQAIEPYREQINLSGRDVPQVLGTLLAAQSMLDKDPAQGLQWIANTYNIDLSKAAQQQEPYYNPQVQELQNRINGLEDQLTQQRTVHDESVNKGILSEIDAFKSEVDSNGNKLRPHYNELEQDIAHFVRQLKPQMSSASNHEILSAAYERAFRANPRTAKIWEKQQQMKAAKKRAKKAEKLSGQVSGAPSGGITETVPDSIRGMLEQLMG